MRSRTVARAAAGIALESVVETEPMTNFVGDRLALVVVGRAATGDGGVEDGAAIIVEVVGARGDGGREVAVSKVAANLLHEVDVEGLVVTLAEGLLHGQLVAVRGPGRVDGLVGASQSEADAVGGKVAVHHGQLVAQHGVGDVTAGEGAKFPHLLAFHFSLYF